MNERRNINLPIEQELLNKTELLASLKGGDLQSVIDSSGKDFASVTSNDADVKKAFLAFVIRVLDVEDRSKASFEDIRNLCEYLPVSSEIVSDPIVQQRVQDALNAMLALHYDVDAVLRLKKSFDIDDEIFSEAIVDTLGECFQEFDLEYGNALLLKTPLSSSHKIKPEMRDNIERFLLTTLREDDSPDFDMIRDLYKRYKGHFDDKLIEAALEDRLLANLELHKLTQVRGLAKEFGLDDKKVDKAFNDCIEVTLEDFKDHWKSPEEIHQLLDATKELYTDPIFRSNVADLLGHYLADGEQHDDIYLIKETLQLKSEELSGAADKFIEAFEADLHSGSDYYEDEDGITDHEKIREETLRHVEELKNLGLPPELIVKAFVENDLANEIVAVSDTLNVDTEKIRKAMGSLVAEWIEKSSFETVNNLIRIGWASDEIEDYGGKFSPATQSFIDIFHLKTLRELIGRIRQQNVLFDYVQKKAGPLALTPEDITFAANLHIQLIEADELKSHGVDFDELAMMKGEERCRVLFDHLSKHSFQWKDEANIRNPFQGGAATFGYSKMFYYTDRPGLTRHDALHAFNNILGLFQRSSLSSKEFYSNILRQIKMDDGSYEEGTAHHYFNLISSSFPKDVEDVFLQAREHTDIKKLGELVEHFKESTDVFASWLNLKKFIELSRLVKQKELLLQLAALKEESEEKAKLYDFITELAFHPGTHVSMESVIDFWRRPASFLSADDDHANEEIHEKKKPSNYIHIPHLDLTAEELRDSLVEGDFDALQAFTPLEIQYTIPPEDQRVPLARLISRALGSHSEGIPGEAVNPKKLFFELNKLFKDRGMGLTEYLHNETALGVLADDFILEVKGILYSNIGLQRQGEMVFVAKINAKSDSDGILAGNDTACCMTFGSGKNTVYMFNPNTALFTIQRKRADGIYRTIAQSVLTKDTDIKVPIPELIAGFESNQPITQLLSQDVLKQIKRTVAADNIEVAQNYRDFSDIKMIEGIYKDFFNEYLKRYGGQQNLQQATIIAGQGYSENFGYLPEKTNTYLPLAPVSYSDKTGENVYLINVSDEYPAHEKVIKEVKKENRQDDSFSIRGISDLTFEDTLAVSYLEGKIYSDNQALIVNLHNIENALIAKDINNQRKGRPNVSLKYTDHTGTMRGYVLAYEGKLDLDDYDYSTESFDGEEVVYISDLAADQTHIIAGGRLIQGFFELYKRHYIDNDRFTPIYFEAREKTTYPLVQKSLHRIEVALGISFELKELDEYEKGDDTMHPILLIPKKR